MEIVKDPIKVAMIISL